MAKNKNKNINNNIVEYKISDFFTKKIEKKDNKLLFSNKINLKELSDQLNEDIEILKKILKLKKSSENIFLNKEQIAEICLSKNIDFDFIEEVNENNVLKKINNLIKDNKWNSDVKKIIRSPIITIMGHVDHGKTTLLDVIKDSNIASKEIGGITQKIGAYNIKYKQKNLTFIDTPGHEIFSEMRTNGSKVTDIVVLVVSADDSIMPQTIESINLSKNENLPIIVAINKIDKSNANISKIKSDLAELGIISDKEGGEYPFVEISALKKINIDTLLENIYLTSQILELEVPVNVFSSGTVIETNLEPKKGNLVTVIVKNGTLNKGDKLLINNKIGSVKLLTNEHLESLDYVGPGFPVEIFGLGFSPKIGSNFLSLNPKDKTYLKMIKNNQNSFLKEKDKSFSLDDFFNETQKKKLNIIIKTDSLGVLDSIAKKIKEIGNEEVEINLVYKGIGELTINNIELAKTSNSIIYQFNLNTPSNLNNHIKNKKIEVLSFNIIYKMFEDLEERILNSKEKKTKEEKVGSFEIISIFNSSKFGSIAGGRIIDGFAKPNLKVKIFRNNNLLLETKIKSLKVEKNNVSQVKKNQECGILLEENIALEEKDIFEFYQTIEYA